MLNNLLQQECARWYADNGEEQYKFLQDLSTSSIVFDLGGYIGEFCTKIQSMYKCDIYSFEPMPQYYEQLSAHNNIKAFNFGLGAKTKRINLMCDGVSSRECDPSIINSQSTQIIKFDDFLLDNNISHIDLLKINIEGGEYDLLDHILHNQLHLTIKNILVQFHINIPHCEERRNYIRSQLSITHDCIFNYNFIWEQWRIK